LWDIESRRSVVIPQRAPVYAVALLNEKLVVGTNRSAICLTLNESLLEELDAASAEVTAVT